MQVSRSVLPDSSWRSRRVLWGLSAALAFALPLPSRAGEAAATAMAATAMTATAILPPAPPWEGKSRILLAPPDDPWITPAERSGFARTPSYAETIAWLERLVQAAPEQLHMVSLGQSEEGRDLWLVVATAGQGKTPAELQQSGKPTLLAQAGIHSGEIDGKDAGLMLLRDLTVRGKKRDLLERANFLFVPIFNVDGHERSSPFGRINQRGPQEVGWRTTARNLNLNRDYMKLDTPLMQAMVRALNRYQPDLYLDLHVTDGMDYQYDITWGWNGPQSHSPAIAHWLGTVLTPKVSHALSVAGHIPGEVIFPFNNLDLREGLLLWNAADPRYSDAYGGLRHQPTVLVENHSLKPYEQRVLGTYVFLASVLQTLGEEGSSLRQAIAQDRARRPPLVPLSWRVPDQQEPEKVRFLAIESRLEPSAISGKQKVVWTGKPVTVETQRSTPTEVAVSVKRPVAYWIPPAWPEVIARLEIHGVQFERIPTPRELEVEMYRITNAQLATQPFEGHVGITATPVLERRRERFPAGSVRVPTDQPLGDLAIALLEPTAPDSFFSWGFFPEILQRTEYFEAYAIEPLAERMLAEDPALAAAFAKKLADDPQFAQDPSARLDWFYRQTPFYDQRYLLYPIARE